MSMRARPKVKTYLLATKLLRWARIGSHPSCIPTARRQSPARNYARLYARHESLARSIGLNPLSAYPPL